MVFIVIAVQNGLDEIKSGLINRGYTVVDIEGYNYPIDAIIYEGTSFQISYVSNNNMPELTNGVRNNYGVLIINSRGKSLNTIEEMLKMRSYEHLF